MSEEGNDDIVSCTDSWVPLLSTKQCHLDKGKDAGGPSKSENTNHLDLMDNFLEKIACLPTESNGIDSSSNTSGDLLSPKDSATLANSQLPADPLISVKPQSHTHMVVESMRKENDVEKAVEDVRCIMQDMLETLHHKSLSDLSTGECYSCMSAFQIGNQQLETALSRIYDFVIILGNEAKIVPGTSPDGGLNQKLDRFSAKYSKAISNEILISLILYSDCIDKIALPENKAAADSLGERYPNVSANFSNPTSDPDVSHEGNLVPTSESTTKSWKCSLKEFQLLKFDTDSIAVNFADCRENFEIVKSQLLETERQLSETKSHLSLAKKSNSLAEMQHGQWNYKLKLISS